MRRAARVDRNQAEIVDSLRTHGASVQPLHTVGKGCPDLLVGIGGQNFLVEVKAEGGCLTKDQHKWHSEWRGCVHILRSTSEVPGFTRWAMGLGNGGLSDE